MTVSALLVKHYPCTIFTTFGDLYAMWQQSLDSIGFFDEVGENFWGQAKAGRRGLLQHYMLFSGIWIKAGQSS